MHRHFYRLVRRWRHPNGYLFECRQCASVGYYAHEFIRYEDYWK